MNPVISNNKSQLYPSSPMWGGHSSQAVISSGALHFHPSDLEPEHLRDERRCVLNSTQKLAFNNYQAFIATADCSREVFKEVCEHLQPCTL